MNKIRCIIFDVGGVILNESIDPVHDALNKKIGKKLFDRKDALHKKLSTGRLTENEFYEKISKKSGRTKKALKEMVVSEYLKYKTLNKGVLKIARSLKIRGYKTAILSNVIPEHKKLNLKIGAYRNFSTLILSCDVKCRKPERKIFRIALDRLHAKPSECVFIDDRKEFLETPGKLGMKTIRFRNASQLRRDLKKLGVNI